jgi:hypothetical protein
MYYAQLHLHNEQPPPDTQLTWDRTSWEDFFDPDWDDEDPPIDPELGDIAKGGK